MKYENYDGAEVTSQMDVDDQIISSRHGSGAPGIRPFRHHQKPETSNGNLLNWKHSSHLQNLALTSRAVRGLMHNRMEQKELQDLRSELANLASTPFLGTYADNISCAIS